MMETVKRSLVAWAGGGRDEEVELRIFRALKLPCMILQ